MAFTRIKTVQKKNGKSYQYRYLEYRWRDGKKVRSKSILIGAVRAVAGFIEANRTRTYGVDWDELEKDALARQEREEAGRQASLNDLHAAYGLTVGPNNPTPIDKAIPDVLTDTKEPEAPAGGPGESPADPY
jgi:hypothetical protein